MNCITCKLDSLNKELEMYNIVEENIQLQLQNLINRLGKINSKKEDILAKISRLRAIDPKSVMVEDLCKWN